MLMLVMGGIFFNTLVVVVVGFAPAAMASLVFLLMGLMGGVWGYMFLLFWLGVVVVW